MTRQEILNVASSLTSSTRPSTYGDPKVNLACAGELKGVITKYILQNSLRDISPAEREAIDLCLTKISRIITGQYHEDNYVDLAAYAAIAGECASHHSPPIVPEEI